MDPSPQKPQTDYTTAEVAEYVTGWLTYKPGEPHTIEEVRSALHNALACLEDIHDGIETRVLNARAREAR